MKNKLLFFLLFCCPLWLIGQYSSTIHYTVKDGLPSSTIYSTEQDSLGFIWIGTEAGLVRFDGSKFKVYTTEDGLPDNEVLGTLFDRETKRLWIITYSKSACYYREGKIYTAQNDSSLHTITCDVGEFIKGNSPDEVNVFLYNGKNIFKCSHNTIKKISTNEISICAVKEWSGGDLEILNNSGLSTIKSGREVKYTGLGMDGICDGGKWIGNRLFLYRIGCIDVYERHKDGNYFPKAHIPIRMDGRRSFTNVIQRGYQYFISVEGTGLFTIDTSLSGEMKKVWSGRLNAISDDNEGDIWISTNDDGLFQIKNQTVHNYSSENGLDHDNVTTLFGHKDGTVFFGNSYGELFSLKDNTISKVNLDNGSNMEMIRGITADDKTMFLLVNNMVCYFDLAAKSVIKIPHVLGGPKSMLKLKDGRTMLLGFSTGLMEYTMKTGSKQELSIGKRVITLAEHPDGGIFCGSLDGLYRFENAKLIHVGGNDPRLQSRITSLCFSPDSILWMGTPSNGIMAYDGKKIIGHITTTNHLSYRGALCRKIVSSGSRNEIWVATNSGIDKISYHISDSLVIDNITPLNTTDGLLSDDVNDIMIHDSLIYVATSHGLTILNERELSNPQPAPIYISSLRINDKDSVIHEGEYNIKYWQNNLRIEYVGIMLPSAGFIRYQYRFLGSGNDKWETTTNTSIEFRSLSSGDYTFEVAVLDKFGNRSKHIARVKFCIAPAFFMTVWFWAIIIVFILSVGFFMIRSRFRRQQAINTKIIDLEQQALKAQMNPHFIFNCLTAIQHFVNKEDVYSANMYLSNFAKLIRKTLDLSGEQYITLDKEVAYLENYIQLEKMRFQDKFNYSITVEKDIDVFIALVPPMLLQPIIENAIRHGLRYKDNNEGLLNVKFSKEGKSIVCRIDDNGIGIKRSKELKTTSHVEYQSKGMKLTESRIAAINMISPKKITMEVKDKYDDTGVAIGTLVIINFEQ